MRAEFWTDDSQAIVSPEKLASNLLLVLAHFRLFFQPRVDVPDHRAHVCFGSGAFCTYAAFPLLASALAEQQDLG
jgi:hypothetical protein